MLCYRDSLEKYELRVRKAKSKPVRDAAEAYLEELRRALEKSDGLDVIFDIVLNIENLYSIGAVEEEMAVATAYYRDLGEKESVLN